MAPDHAVQDWIETARKWDIAQVRRVSERATAEIIDGTLCDVTSAGAAIAVFDALSPENQDRAQRLSFARFGSIAWKLVR